MTCIGYHILLGTLATETYGMTLVNASLDMDLERNVSVVTPMDLELILGPARQELYNVIPMTLIYCVIFITGMIGNVLTCVVIACNKYMQTSTNYYLLNLAVSDLLVLLLGLPQETYSFWSAYPWLFGETFCVLRTLAAETSSNSSVLTITAFSVERYVAICHPVLKCPTLSSLQRALKMIVIVWTISCICSLPIVIQYGVVYIHDNTTGLPIPESATCNIRPDRYVRHAFELSSLLFFLVPVTLISVLYGLIGLAIRRTSLKRTWSGAAPCDGRTGENQSRAARGRGSLKSRSACKATVDERIDRLQSPLRRSLTDTNGIRQQNTKARVAALKLLVAVVVAFMICWAPFHIQRLMSVYGTDSKSPILLNVILFYTSGILYYVSSVINPILYNVMSLKFRRAFRNTLLPHVRRQRRMRKKRRTDDVIVVDKQMPYRFNSPSGASGGAAGPGGELPRAPRGAGVVGPGSELPCVSRGAGVVGPLGELPSAPKGAGMVGPPHIPRPSSSQNSESSRDQVEASRFHRPEGRSREGPRGICSVEHSGGSSVTGSMGRSSMSETRKLHYSCDHHTSQRRSPIARCEQRPHSSSYS